MKKKPYLILSSTLLLFVFLSFPLRSVSQVVEVNPEPISLEEALKLAPESDKKILIDVYAEWCPYCQRMHSEVYKNDDVIKAIADHYIWVKINVESDQIVNYHGNEMTEAQFARALENESVPTTYFLNQEGSILGSQPGFIEADMFSSLLKFVGSDEYLVQTFQEYQNN
jgi:thioredoxin-related protein